MFALGLSLWFILKAYAAGDRLDIKEVREEACY